MSVLEIIALALSASSIVMLGVLVLRRSHLTRQTNQQRAMEDGLKGIAMELMHEGAEPPSQLGDAQRRALADELSARARVALAAKIQKAVINRTIGVSFLFHIP